MKFNDLEAAIRSTQVNAPADKDIISDALALQDVNADYLQRRDYYAWLWAAARVLRPKSIAEIGVRLGYSAIAMLRGADSDGVTYDGYDAEAYIAGSNAIAEANIIRAVSSGPPERHIALTLVDTQTVSDLGIRDRDLFFVDGDHSYDGALHDLRLAYATTRPGGIILFDDVDMSGECRRAGDAFVREKGVQYFHLPTFRGLYVIERSHG